MDIRLWMFLSIITGIFSSTCIAQSMESLERLEAVEECNVTFNWTYSGSVTTIDWFKGKAGQTDATIIMIYNGVDFLVAPEFKNKITYIDPNEVSDTVGMILLSANTDDSHLYSVQISPVPGSGAPVDTDFTAITASEYRMYKETVEVAINGLTSIEHDGSSDHVLSATGPGPVSIVVTVPDTYNLTTTTCIHHHSNATETSCGTDCVTTSCSFMVLSAIDEDSIVISIQPDVLQCAELFRFTVPVVDDTTTTTITTQSDSPDTTVSEPNNLATSNSSATTTDKQITSDHATDDPGVGTTDDDNEESDSALELWHKVLIGLGCALVLIIIIVIIVCCVRRKDNKSPSSMSSAGSADGELTDGYHNTNVANRAVIQAQKESPVRSPKHGAHSYHGNKLQAGKSDESDDMNKYSFSGNGSPGGPGLGYSPVARGYGGGGYHLPGHLDQPGHPGAGVLVAQGAHVSVNVGARPVVANVKNPHKRIVSGYNGAYTNPVYDYRSEPQTDY